MRRWLHTTHATFWFGERQERRPAPHHPGQKTVEERFYYAPDFETLQLDLERFVEHATRTQAEVKAVIPLTRSLARTVEVDQPAAGVDRPARSFGHAFAAAHTAGFLVILQHSEEISDEAYEERLRAFETAALRRETERALAPILTDLSRAKADLDRVKQRRTSFELVEKRHVLGGPTYSVGDEEFDRKSEAESYSLKMKSIVPDLEARIAALTTRRAELEAILAELD